MASARADINNWVGGTNGYWTNGANWSLTTIPGVTDDVVISNNSHTIVYLDQSTAISSLSLTNSGAGKTNTLTFLGTNTVLTATDITIQNRGVITHAAQSAIATNSEGLWVPDNYIQIVCTNLTVAFGGAINASYMGYAGGISNGVARNGCGPGGGTSGGSGSGNGGGGGYGGRGGNGGVGLGGATNGIETAPQGPGSGGGGGVFSGVQYGGRGGGYVSVLASGALTVNGIISAVGSNGGVYAGGGSGGGVYLRCGTFGGSGLVSVNGGADSYDGGGGGGRIAVIFDQTNAPSVSFSANGGRGGTAAKNGRSGTLYLSQYDGVLSEVLQYGLELATNRWSPQSLTISNALVIFRPDFLLNVSGAMLVTSSAIIELWESGTCNCTNLSLSGSTIYCYSNVLLNVQGGDLTLSGSALHFYPGAGETNVATMSLTSASTNYLYADQFDGYAARPLVLTNLVVDGGSAIDASLAGYRGGYTSGTNGYGPGGGRSGANASGAGYGGRGGNYGALLGGINYGVAEFPTNCGSGGGGSTWPAYGGWGGGLIQIQAAWAITNDGTISANGGNGGAAYAGGGAGGGIYIQCAKFDGIGQYQAIGGNGNGSGAGGGGGGRIAVHYTISIPWTGSLTATNGLKGGGGLAGETGSVYIAQQIPLGMTNLSVEGSPDRYGASGVSPAYGTCAFLIGSNMTASVASPADSTNDLRRACYGWTGTGDVPASGDSNQVSFTLSALSSITWLWTNQYYLAMTSGPNGSLVADLSGWYTSGVTVASIQAGAAAEGYHFYQWSGDVPDGQFTNTTISVLMDQAKTVQANYVGDTGTDKIWVGGTGYWYVAENWSPVGIPGEYDAAFITNGLATLDSPATVVAVTVSNGVLRFEKWFSILTASNVSVLGSGTITHIACTTNDAQTNRVYIVCTNLAVGAGAAIHGDYAGYRGGLSYIPAGPGVSEWAEDGYGPGRSLGAIGSGYSGGAGHGGIGANGSGTAGGGIYDSLIEPEAPGSGTGYGRGGGWGYLGHSGGGAIRLAVSGVLTLDGRISADGESSAYGGYYGGGGGSGGSIWINSDSFSGAGIVRANGGANNGNGVNYYGNGGGGGGRVAIYANDAGGFSGFLSVRGGHAGNGNGLNINYDAAPGTLYLGNQELLWETCGRDEAGEAVLYNASNSWSVTSLTVTNYGIWFPTNAILSTTGDVTLVGGGKITLPEFGDLSCRNLTVSGSNTYFGISQLFLGTNRYVISTNSVTCTGDFNMDRTRAYLYPGSLVTVGGTLMLTNAAYMYLYCHPTSGVTPRILKMDGLELASDCVFTADSYGFAGGDRQQNGQGPGYGTGASYAGGAGYGGAGGNGVSAGGLGGITYGSSNNPVDAGSGGGGGNWTGGGGAGGGYIGLRIMRTATINGIITANGGNSIMYNAGGSGGGINIHCDTIDGSGVIRANGGAGGFYTSYQGGGGGGGRIAIRCLYNHYFGTTSVTNGAGFQPGQVGTIYWRIQAPGTLLRVW